MQTSFIDNPRDIERLYKAGLLVSKEKISTAHIEVELNRSNEYRIVKIQHEWTYDYGKDKRTGVILEACKLYEVYSKATQLQLFTVIEGVVDATGAPMFKNKELMSKFKVSTPKDLVRAILLSGEIAKIYGEISELAGFGDNAVKEVKNS